MIGRTSSHIGASNKFSRRRNTGLCSIVSNGLQLHLDAGNPSSYVGSGTTVNDLSSNGYTSTLVSNVGYSTNGGGTFTYDGTTGYIDTNQSLAFNSFTVGAWFKTSAAGIKMILSKETSLGNPWNYRIWLNGGQLIADIAQGATQSSLTSPLTSYNDNSWYNVMFARDDNNWYLYVNGSQVATKVDNLTGTITNSQEVWIGSSEYLGGSYQYNGSIAQILIYNRVLSSSEILQNYNCHSSRYA